MISTAKLEGQNLRAPRTGAMTNPPQNPSTPTPDTVPTAPDTPEESAPEDRTKLM